MAEMGTDVRFACDPEVVGKVIDGEAIIINLASGMYYSADEVGGLIWTLFESGNSIGEVAGHVAAHYQVDADQARADVERLAARLVEEGLIQQADRKVEGAEGAGTPPSERRAYTTPSLQVYRDMKDLLALDPPMQALKRDPWDQT